jgi:hypothetical protein
MDAAFFSSPEEPDFKSLHAWQSGAIQINVIFLFYFFSDDNTKYLCMEMVP